MNIGNSIVLIVASHMVVCGCDNGGKDSSFIEGKIVADDGAVAASDVVGGGVITLEKKTAHRSCVLKIGEEDRMVSFVAEMEYPMHFGIPKQEYRNMTSFVDEMFNNGTNFWLDRDGVHWGYWAGEIFAGCNGHMTISLTWEKLNPIVRKDFIVPVK